MIKPDEAVDDLPEVRDPLGLAVSQMLAHIFEALPMDCVERRAELVTVIECHNRLGVLLSRHQRLN